MTYQERLPPPNDDLMVVSSRPLPRPECAVCGAGPIAAETGECCLDVYEAINGPVPPESEWTCERHGEPADRTGDCPACREEWEDDTWD